MANTITAAEMAEFERLGAAARPINDDDWGTERQIDAQNAFFTACGMDDDEDALGEDFAAYIMKATAHDAKQGG